MQKVTRSNFFIRAIVLAIILWANFNYVFAQTFINSPVYALPNTVRNDTVNVGPISFSPSNDNKVWAIIRSDQNEISRVIKYDSVGNQICNMQITQSYTLSWMNTTGIYSCPDNGSVFATNRFHSAPLVESKAYRLTASGQTMWTKNFSNSTGGTPPQIYSIKPTFYNTSILQFWDSIVDINSTGQILRSRAFTGTFQTVPDSDLIVYSNSQITREDFNGNVLWIISQIGSPLFSDSNYFYTRAHDTITKFRNIDGSIVWQRIVPCFDISIKKDGGYLTCGIAGSYSNDICNFDSSGNLIWCKNIPFPLYGFRRVTECNPNSFLTGGATICFKSDYMINKATAAFVCSLDSIGNGVIDSTDHYNSGNANDNGALGFIDDSPYIAAAFANSGPSRCPVMSGPYKSAYAVYGTDWNTHFGTGLNHKYSDVDGNGIIDSLDLVSLQNNVSLTLGVSSHWRISLQGQNANPSFKMLAREDSIFAGDSVTVDVIIGDSSIAVDSIYSIAIAFQSDFLFSNAIERTIIPISDFGNTQTDLFVFSAPSNMYFGGNTLLCKTDHQNVNLLYDTIVTFRVPSPSGQGYPSKFYKLTPIVNAITKEGFSVNLNAVVNDSIYYSDPFANIVSANKPVIELYPNPSNGFVNISNNNSENLKIKILDSTGRIINSALSSEEKIRLDLSEFSDGLYFVQINSSNGFVTKSFMLQR